MIGSSMFRVSSFRSDPGLNVVKSRHQTVGQSSHIAVISVKTVGWKGLEQSKSPSNDTAIYSSPCHYLQCFKEGVLSRGTRRLMFSRSLNTLKAEKLAWLISFFYCSVSSVHTEQDLIHCQVVLFVFCMWHFLKCFTLLISVS